MNERYEAWKLLVGVLATVGLYSVLYRENKFYRFFEHMFLGLAAGFTIVAVWKETLYEPWWTKMVGQVPNPEIVGDKGAPGYFAYMLLLPFGLMGYMVFNKRLNWMSRIPIGIILGLWAGQQIQTFWNTWGKQIENSMRPIFPTSAQFLTPDRTTLSPAQAEALQTQVLGAQAVNNAIFVFTVLAVLSYFFFSFDTKSKIFKNMNTSGRWLLMVGLGAIFGSTVMARFALVIDRMFFIFVEFLQGGMHNLFR